MTLTSSYDDKLKDLQGHTDESKIKFGESYEGRLNYKHRIKGGGFTIICVLCGKTNHIGTSLEDGGVFIECLSKSCRNYVTYYCQRP